MRFSFLRRAYNKQTPYGWLLHNAVINLVFYLSYLRFILQSMSCLNFKGLLRRTKAWKVFTSKFQIKLHRLNGSKKVKKLPNSEPYKPRKKHRWPYLSIPPKKFKLRHKSRASTHLLRRRTPSVYVDQLFIEPASVLEKHPVPITDGSTNKEKSCLNSKQDQLEKSSDGSPSVQGSADAADELWESVVMNSPQMRGINERAEEFIARFRADMHHQEMAARRL